MSRSYGVAVLRCYGVVLCLVLMSGWGYAQQTPPAGALLFKAPPAPAPNTQFIYERSNGKRYSQTVSEDTSPYQGRAVYRITRGRRNPRRNTVDSATHNLIAVHRSGTLMRYYVPHESEFDWPLWVGKFYRINFQQVIVVPRGRGRTGSFFKYGQVEVEAMETITTPAGTFETMRIEIRIDGWDPITIWRARDIPLHVKFARDGREREVLAKIRKRRKR